ncbi:MAG: gliding motility-associated C-terminal domain-containing protein [Saprospiraceae bacterium]|nr:gliding motility-associated C-terminal domain-containing protein [Saprospiraceae bacterium]
MQISQGHSQIFFNLGKLALFAFLFFGKGLLAQDYFQKTLDRNFRDVGRGVAVLPNGDIMLAGATGPVGNEQMWLHRLNQKGEPLWSKMYQGNGAEIAVDIHRVQNGDGFWVIFNSNGAGGWMKISDSGDVLLAQRVSMPSTFSRLLPLADGGILISGRAEANPFSRALVLKINSSGNVVWQNVFGGQGNDALEHCWEDMEGFLHCVGYSANFDGHRDGLLARLSPTGAVLWTRRYGSSGTDQFTSIAPFVNDSSLLLAGYSNGFGGLNEVWLMKTTRTGAVRWSRTYTAPNLNLGAMHLQGLLGNQFIVSAADPQYQVGSPAVLFKISEDGDLLWEYEYKSGGERAALREVVPTMGGFAAVGSATINGNEEFYLVKIAADGLLPSADCCPVSAKLVVKDAMPTTQPYVPNTAAGFNTIGQQVSGTTAEATLTDLCVPIDLDFAVSDSSICPGECVEITIVGNTPGVTYSFSTPGGVPDPDNPLRVCYPNDGFFLIDRKGQSSVCSKNRTVRIEVGNRPDAFPNAFTPNGDNVNDRFKPLFFCPVTTTLFRVYNRWGLMVFETNDPAAAWDGRVDGKDAPSDVYVWWVEYEVLRDGQRQRMVRKGEVALLR